MTEEVGGEEERRIPTAEKGRPSVEDRGTRLPRKEPAWRLSNQGLRTDRWVHVSSRWFWAGSLGTWMGEGLGGEVGPKALEEALLEGTRVGRWLPWL